MTTAFNPGSYSYFNPASSQAGLQYLVSLYAQTNPQVLQSPYLAALQGLQLPDTSNWQQFQANNFGPGGCIPPPQIEFSGAPAGRGLTQIETPANAIRTAGGYTIVPETEHRTWKIYGPDQDPSDPKTEPMTKVWGDPHVIEKDGTKWDFTKNGNFRLPDGTNIQVTTSGQTGQSVTDKLDITNGADHFNVDFTKKTDKGQPTQTYASDGYLSRALIDKGQDTFHLTGNAEKQKWFREHDGRMEGEVTGTEVKKAGDGQTYYDQKIDENSKYDLAPDPWRMFTQPEAWGNQLRDEAVDIARRLYGNEWAQEVAKLMDVDHQHGLLTWANGGRKDPAPPLGGYNPGPFMPQPAYDDSAQYGAFNPLLALGGYGQFGGWQQQAFSVGGLFQFLAQQEAQYQWFQQQRVANPIGV